MAMYYDGGDNPRVGLRQPYVEGVSAPSSVYLTASPSLPYF